MTSAITRARADRDNYVLGSPIYRLSRTLVVGLGVTYAVSTVIPFSERPALLDTWF